VLASSIEEPTTVSAVSSDRFIVKVDNISCTIWNVLPCWHRWKLDIGQGLGFGKDFSRESMSAFANARTRWCSKRATTNPLGAFRTVLEVAELSTAEAGLVGLASRIFTLRVPLTPGNFYPWILGSSVTLLFLLDNGAVLADFKGRSCC
jgi:hypothetical protein